MSGDILASIADVDEPLDDARARCCCRSDAERCLFPSTKFESVERAPPPVLVYGTADCVERIESLDDGRNKGEVPSVLSPVKLPALLLDALGSRGPKRRLVLQRGEDRGEPGDAPPLLRSVSSVVILRRVAVAADDAEEIRSKPPPPLRTSSYTASSSSDVGESESSSSSSSLRGSGSGANLTRILRPVGCRPAAGALDVSLVELIVLLALDDGPEECWW